MRSISQGCRERADQPRCAGRATRRLLCSPLWIIVICFGLTGCQAILSPISGIPARLVPPEFLVQPRADWQEINLARLRRDPPPQYLIDGGDVLGIYIEGVLGQAEEAPPVHMPEPESDLPPALGYPVPVREDGTLALPLVPALKVRGLTLGQVESEIRKAYTVDQQILAPGRDRIIVTLIRERTVRVIVVRQDMGSMAGGMRGGGRGGMLRGPDESARGHVVNLPAYKNDVMHAMAQTGGLPGLNAKNEVKILRGRLADAELRDQFIREFYQQYQHDPCFCPPPLPDDPSIVRIPLRLPPGMTPTFRPEDIILEEGDIVYIESREAEVYYTGGLLPGGEHLLPRDYDLDVLAAMALAGQGIASAGGGRGGGGMGGMGGMGMMLGAGIVPPTRMFILRPLPCGNQITISVDLTQAMQNPRDRILVGPGDILILRHKPAEEVTNFAIGTFFTFGVAEIMRSTRGRR